MANIKYCLNINLLSGVLSSSAPTRRLILYVALRRKLSAEELDRKRREMMEQAKQREEDRENNVKRYKRQDEQDKQREQNAKHDRHAGFIQ